MSASPAAREADDLDEPLDLGNVDEERRASVAMDRIAADEQAHRRQHRRARSFSPREALIALQFEATLVMVAAGNLARGLELSDVDRFRLGVAVQCINAICDEANR